MHARKLFLTLAVAVAAGLLYSASAFAQVQVETQNASLGTTVSPINVQNLPTGRSFAMLLQMDPKSGSTAVTVTQNGPVTLPSTFVPPTDPSTNVTYGKCKNGTVYASGNGVKVACAGYVPLGSSPWNQPFTVNASFLGAPFSTFSPQTSMGMTGAGIQVQLDGYGGLSFINGNTPATGGFDGTVLFPLGSRVLVGPTAGFQWIDSSIVATIGSHETGSTFIDTSAGFKEGNFGGSIAFPFGGWQLGAQAGATVAGANLTQAYGYCGGTTPTGGSSTACTVSSSYSSHDIVVGPFVGGYVSHSILSHVGVFVRYDYQHLKDTSSSSSSSSSSTSSTVFDVNFSNFAAGFDFSWGGHKAK